MQWSELIVLSPVFVSRLSQPCRGKPLRHTPEERRCPCSGRWSRLPHPAHGWSCRCLQGPDRPQRWVHQWAAVPEYPPQPRGQERIGRRSLHLWARVLRCPVSIADGQPVDIKPHRLLRWIWGPSRPHPPPVISITHPASGAFRTRPALRHHQRHHHVW